MSSHPPNMTPEEREQLLIDRIDELETCLREVEDWADAYPDQVFTPLRGDPIAKTGDYDTAEKRNLITRASASMGRHILRSVGRMCRDALGYNERFRPHDDIREMNQWKGIGRYLINGIEDWSSGRTDRAVYITPGLEQQIRTLLGDTPNN